MSPPRKKNREEEAKPDALQSVIQFEVDRVSLLDQEGRNTREVELGGLMWRANVCRLNDGAGGTYLAVFLYCAHEQITPWSLKVSHEFVLTSKPDASLSIVDTLKSIYDNSFDHWGGYQVSWPELVDVKRGFVRDDKMSIEVRFSILSMKGIRTVPRIDFSDPNERCHDVTLLVEGRRVFASKQILATHSPAFKEMFYGSFEDTKEIELENVKWKEFVEMLRVIYPSHKKISIHTAEYLLVLGAQFEITYVIDRAEQFLIDSCDFPNMEKLRIADKHKLHALLQHCLAALRTTEHFEEVQTWPIYNDLSAETVKALLDRCIKTRQ